MNGYDSDTEKGTRTPHSGRMRKTMDYVNTHKGRSWFPIAALIFLAFVIGYSFGGINAQTTIEQHQIYVHKTGPLTPQKAVQSSNDSAAQEIFSNIYSTSYWGESGGGSGEGSSVEFTKRIRLLVELLVCKLGIRAVLDAPCGAMVRMPLALERIENSLPCPGRLYSDFYYHGVDIVPSVIQANQDRFASIPNWEFSVVDFGNDALPNGYDLIFSRDALQHLSYEIIVDALENFAMTDSKFLAVGSYKEGENFPIETGAYFPIDLRKAPFSLDFPIEVLDEESNDGKLLLVYDLDDIRQKANFPAMRKRAGLV